MKKLILFTSLCLTLLLLSTSCGTISITKRQHSKGYHIAHSNIKQNNNSKEEENDFNTLVEKQETVEKTESKSEFVEIKKKDTKSTEGKTEIVSGTEASNQTDNSLSKNTHEELAKENFEVNPSLNQGILKNTAQKIKNTFKDSTGMKSSSESEDDSDLSLFWIIIILILILWLLGFLGGLGQFIHLLLVVALILLILWLIGII